MHRSVHSLDNVEPMFLFNSSEKGQKNEKKNHPNLLKLKQLIIQEEISSISIRSEYAFQYAEQILLYTTKTVHSILGCNLGISYHNKNYENIKLNRLSIFSYKPLRPI